MLSCNSDLKLPFSVDWYTILEIIVTLIGLGICVTHKNSLETVNKVLIAAIIEDKGLYYFVKVK